MEQGNCLNGFTSSSHEITQGKKPVEIVESKPSLKAGPGRASCLELCPVGFWLLHRLLFIHSEEHSNMYVLCHISTDISVRGWYIKPRHITVPKGECFHPRLLEGFFCFWKISTWFTISLLLSVTEYNIKRSQGIQAFHAQLQLRNCSRDTIQNTSIACLFLMFTALQMLQQWKSRVSFALSGGVGRRSRATCLLLNGDAIRGVCFLERLIQEDFFVPDFWKGWYLNKSKMCSDKTVIHHVSNLLYYPQALEFIHQVDFFS